MSFELYLGDVAILEDNNLIAFRQNSSMMRHKNPCLQEKKIM